MEFKEYFKEDNSELLFDCIRHEDEFIACANDCYSEYETCDTYTRNWAWQFPSGRYVIIVYQRYAVYQNGTEIYLNDNFKNEVSRSCRYNKLKFSLITKNSNKYYIPSWNNYLNTHSVQDENEPLQNKCFDSIEKACDAAAEYSENGNTVAVVSWFADYDMY